MSLFKLAYSNFKRSVKNYVALIISLSFSIFTFFNFQNIVFSNAMDVLKEKNSDYIAIIIQVISIVLIIFVFFFDLLKARGNSLRFIVKVLASEINSDRAAISFNFRSE